MLPGSQAAGTAARSYLSCAKHPWWHPLTSWHVCVCALGVFMLQYDRCLGLCVCYVFIVIICKYAAVEWLELQVQKEYHDGKYQAWCPVRYLEWLYIYHIYDISYIISYNMMACDSLNPGTTTNKGFPSSGLHTSSCLSSSGRLRFQKLVSGPPIGCWKATNWSRESE